MDKNERIIAKLDGIVEIYNKSVELNKDDCIRVALLDFIGNSIQVFSPLEEIADALGWDIETTDITTICHYRGVQFFKSRDFKQELKETKEKLKLLESKRAV